jgi:hypothetical protein
MSSIDCARRLAGYQRAVEVSAPRPILAHEEVAPRFAFVQYASEIGESEVRSGGVPPPCCEGVPRPHRCGWEATSGARTNRVTARDAGTTRRDATATMFITYATEVPA